MSGKSRARVKCTLLLCKASAVCLKDLRCNTLRQPDNTPRVIENNRAAPDCPANDGAMAVILDTLSKASGSPRTQTSQETYLIQGRSSPLATLCRSSRCLSSLTCSSARSCDSISSFFCSKHGHNLYTFLLLCTITDIPYGMKGCMQ